mgnify:CR=1 FL=1
MGSAIPGSIRESYATGDVAAGGSLAGGLVGNSGGSIVQCYATGAVFGFSGVGGLAGANSGIGITECYASGSVEGDSNVGALVGTNNAAVNRSYATGSVRGNSYLGGLIGRLSGGTISNCFWDMETTKQTGPLTGATGLSTLQMMQSNTFTAVGWDFVNVWVMREGNSYPFFLNTIPPDSMRTISVTAIGNGTVELLPSAYEFVVWSLITVTATPAPGHVFAGWVGDGFGEVPLCRANSLPLVVARDIEIEAIFLEDAPIALSCIDDVQRIGRDRLYPCNWNYFLTQDLDAFDTRDWNSGKGFAPIPPFRGSFDGKGHVIKEIFINRPDESRVGVFSALLNGGIIQNCSIESGEVTGNWGVGCLLGACYSSTVAGCYSEGIVNGDIFVGGLVGEVEYGEISDCIAVCDVIGVSGRIGGLAGIVWNDSYVLRCCAQGSVAGNGPVGGLVGYLTNTGATVSHSYACGNVSGNAKVGGLVGESTGVTNVTQSYATGNVTGNSNIGGLIGVAGTVIACYATGAVSGTDKVGGLVGSGGTTTRCYATGSVSGTTNLGGLIGGGGTVTSSFWDTDTGGPDNGYGVGLPTVQMKQQATFETAGWDFTGSPPDWMMFENLTYPQIYGMLMPVESVETLQALAYMPAGNFYLTRDIDARSTATWADKSGEPGFTPIGTLAQPFNGILDGRGHRIFGLTINRPGLDGAGLFGHVGANAVIRGIGLDDAAISGGNRTGGLIGVNAGTVEQCYARGSVSGGHETGGLVGSNSGGVTESYAATSLSGLTLGGLVGADNGGTVASSFWDTAVSGVLTSGGGTGLVTGMLQTASTYTGVGWDMANTWALVEGLSYPYFRNSASVRVTTFPATLINADSVDIGLESFVPDLFVTVGGGAYPAYYDFAAAGPATLTISLKQEAINYLTVSTLSATGEECIVARFKVYESAAFPSVPTPVASLALSPVSLSLAVDASQQFIATATFTDGTTAPVTPVANWNTSGGAITAAGLYTHAAGTHTVRAVLHTDQGWRSSNLATVTTSKSDPDAKADMGRVNGVLRSHYTGLGLPQGEVTVYPVFNPGVAGQFPMYDSLGNYVFFLNEGFYHIEGTNPGHRSELWRGGMLLESSKLIDPGPPPVYSEPVYSGRVRVDRPLEYNFALRPNDAQAPWVYYVEPPADCTVNEEHLVVTAINADKYSELAVATFTLNTNTHDVREHISTTGFYRDTWPLELGLNTMRLFSMDTEGNASERSLEVVYDPEYVPGGEDPPPPDGPPATECVRMTIANFVDGMALRGDAVTLLAEAFEGDPGAVDAVSFEARGAGTGGVWVVLGTSLKAPYALNWDADAYPPGAYQLRAVAVSLDGCVDSAAVVTEVTVSAEAPYHERVEAGVHTLTAPVSAATDTVLALRAGERFARIVLPAGAVAADDVLTAFFPEASGFTPALSDWQRDAGLYLDVSLQHHAGDFLNGKRATLAAGYPDADGDDLLDGTDLRVSQLFLRFLPGPSASFVGLYAPSITRTERCVVGETAHFSTFGIVEEQEAPPLNLLTDRVPAGTAGVAYTAELQASGGVPPYTWSMISGALPPGLSVNGNLLAGTPTVAGEYTFTLQVADSQSIPYLQSMSFTLAIFAADQPAVTVTRAAGQAGLANALPLVWDISFSETVTGFDTGDLVLTGTAASGAAYEVSGGGANYTLTLTDLVYDGTLRPTVPAGVAMAGALNRASSGEEEIWVDRKAPLVLLTSVYAGLQEYGETGPVLVEALPVMFTLAFDEPVTGLEASDISFLETISGLAYEIQGAGSQYTLLVTGADGPVTLTPVLAAEAVYDGAGNGNLENAYAGRTVQYTPDLRRTVTLNQDAGQADPASGFPIVYQIVFSDEVTGFETGDVVYISGAGSAPDPVYAVSGSGATYTLTVSGASGDGRLAFHIPEDVTIEGNAASSSIDNGVTLDTTPPALVIGAPSPLRSWKGPVSFPIAYTGATSISLAPADITLNGAPTAQVAVTGTGAEQRVVTLTNISGTGSLGIGIAAGTAVDGAGNAALASGPSETVQIETPPLVVITRAAGQAALDNTLPVVFDVVFDKVVTGFTASDVTQSGSAPGVVFSLDGAGPAYTLSVTGIAGNGTIVPRIAAGVCVDSAGNPNEASTGINLLVVYDATPPNVIINQAAGQSDPAAALPLVFDIVFSETVTGFEVSDILFEGTASGLSYEVTGAGAAYTLRVTAITDDGTVIPVIPAGACQDAADNGNTPSTSTDNSVTYDVTPPAVTVNQAPAQPDPTNMLPIVYDVVFSEPVTGFGVADVSMIGTASGVVFGVTGSGAAYSITVTGVSGDGAVVPVVPAGGCQDAAGNGNAPSTSTDNSVTYDTTAPTVTVNQAAGQQDPSNALPLAFAVVFSEAVTGFDSEDVVISGTAGGVVHAVDGLGDTYTIQISAVEDDGTVIPTIPADVCQDAAGNGNAASTSTDNSVRYDTAVPAFSAITAAPSPAGAGAAVTIAFTASESLQAAPEVTVNGNAATQKSHNGLDYEYTYTVQAGDPGGPAALLISGTDPAGNAGQAEDATLLVIDHTKPTADFSAAPRSGMPSLEVSFTDLSTPAGSTPLTDWTWDFGDGSPVVIGQAPPPHTYTSGGVYTVTLTVTDAAANSDSEIKAGYIVVGGPNAAFTADPASGHAPLTVQFTDTSEPGSEDITEWLWDFGDGGSSTEANPSHTYLEQGVYSVSLSVTSPISGDTILRQDLIEVWPGTAPTADFTATPTVGEAPLEVRFTDTSDPGTSPIEAWQWDFGDGATSAETDPVHVYAVPGAYTVTLTVTNAVGSDTMIRVNYITVLVAMPAAGLFGIMLLTVTISVVGAQIKRNKK